MSNLSLRLFGPPRIEFDDQQIEINRRKAVALLAYLAVTKQSQSRDALAVMFWPEASQSRARAALRSALWALNKTPVEDWLVVESEMVSLRPLAGSAQTVQLDVDRFTDLLEGAQAHDHPPTESCAGCLDALAQAVALYQDDFMAGFTLPDAPDFDEWQFFQADSLRSDLALAFERLIEIHSNEGQFSQAIPYARRLVALDPLHEAAHRTLMKLYARAEQRSAALRQYEICRETLDAELGLEPSAETQDLYRRIRSGAWPMAAPAKESEAVEPAPADAGLPAKPANPHNLPPDSTPLIGREQELAQLAAFLGDQATRLLTIVGPGGIGKTRLALAAAADQVSQTNFPDGIFFVSLAPLPDPEAIVPAIAAAVGYPFQSDQRSPQQQLFDYLSQKSLLLLLDNLEHLLFKNQSDGAVLVAELLQRAPQLKILTTSRERLNLFEEQLYPLQGLAVAPRSAADPGTDYAAAVLFLQSIRRRQPDFAMAAADVPHLADICRLVEGMPLALELAASRLEMLSLGEIAAEIQQNLDFLATDMRNVPDRHRSMQAVFDASWRSLTAKQKEIYARLAVFRAGFTREAAKMIAGASLPALGGLVNKSLLRFRQNRQRYEIHELLRQYAAEQLADAGEAARDQHAAYFSAFLQQREADLKGPRQREALAEIEADAENARAAYQWAIEQLQSARLAQALVPLAIYYQWRRRLHEGELICRLAVEKLVDPQVDEAKEIQTAVGTAKFPVAAQTLVEVLTWQGYFNLTLNQYANARQALRQAQLILDDPALAAQKNEATNAFLLLQLSNLAMVDDFGGQATELAEQSLALYQSVADSWGMALALDALSQIYMNQGVHEQAFQLQEECLAIRQSLNDHRGIARSYNLLGLLVLHMGQIDRSEAYLRQSLALFRTMDNRADLSTPLAVLGINLLFGGKFAACIASYEECWAIHRELGLPQEPFVAGVTTTRAKINLGRYDEARIQALADLTKYRNINHSWSIAFTLFNLGRIDLAEEAPHQARRRLQESAEILNKMNERSLLPDVFFCLAYTFRALGDRQQAVQAMVQALRLVVETGPLNPMRFELPGMALLLADQGETERAVEFYAASLQSPYINNSRWFDEIAGRTIAEAAAALPQDVVTAAEKRGQERDLWLTANALLAELSTT